MRKEYSPDYITDRTGASTAPTFSDALITLQNHRTHDSANPNAISSGVIRFCIRSPVAQLVCVIVTPYSRLG